MLNPEFNRLLWRRKETVATVAAQIFCNQWAVMQVLGGKRKGTPTWRKLASVLTKEEYELARKFADERREKLQLPVAPFYRPEDAAKTDSV